MHSPIRAELLLPPWWQRAAAALVFVGAIAAMFAKERRAAVVVLAGCLIALAIGAALWLDLDDPKAQQQVAGYDVLQNLRLITTNRKNVWAANNRHRSEAALAIDAEGRLLFLFSRASYSMREWNALLLRLPLKIAGAMHLEGGPEASLSIHAGGVDLDLAGSYETGFWADDSNQRQWPIPNVLGVLRDKE